VLALVVAGCRLDLAVDVVVEDDGSGTIAVVATFDDDAVDRVGGDLAQALELDDLVAAGWEVSAPATVDEGTAVRLEQPFDDLEEARSILSELSGPDGPLMGLRVDQETTFARSTWTFDGQIDFSAGVGALGDQALAEVLDGEPVGLSEAELEEELGGPLADALGVEVSVRLPDDGDGGASSWAADYGDPPVDLSASGTQARPGTWVALGITASCVALLCLYGGVRLVRGRRRRRGRRGAHLADDGGT
jgi:hypothetical protein